MRPFAYILMCYYNMIDVTKRIWLYFKFYLALSISDRVARSYNVALKRRGIFFDKNYIQLSKMGQKNIKEKAIRLVF